LCGVAPDGETNIEAGVVDKSELTLVVWLLAGFRYDLRNLAYRLQDTDSIDGSVLLYCLKIGDSGEVVADLRNSLVVLGLTIISKPENSAV